MKKRYETLIIFDVGLGEEGIEKLIEKIQTIITSSENGEVIKIDRWGKKRLAYMIKKKQFGYYVLFEFLCEPGVPREMERVCRYEADIIRYMTIVIPDIVLKLKDREVELKASEALRRLPILEEEVPEMDEVDLFSLGDDIEEYHHEVNLPESNTLTEKAETETEKVEAETEKAETEKEKDKPEL